MEAVGTVTSTEKDVFELQAVTARAGPLYEPELSFHSIVALNLAYKEQVPPDPLVMEMVAFAAPDNRSPPVAAVYHPANDRPDLVGIEAGVVVFTVFEAAVFIE